MSRPESPTEIPAVKKEPISLRNAIKNLPAVRRGRQVVKETTLFVPLIVGIGAALTEGSLYMAKPKPEPKPDKGKLSQLARQAANEAKRSETAARRRADRERRPAEQEEAKRERLEAARQKILDEMKHLREKKEKGDS